MIETIDIPFIVRGQEVRACELLYRSQDGKVQFRYPDPRPLLSQIALSDPVQLQRDFARVSRERNYQISWPKQAKP